MYLTIKKCVGVGKGGGYVIESSTGHSEDGLNVFEPIICRDWEELVIALRKLFRGK